MSLWLGITLVAAFLQNVRSLLQKRLTGRLSVNGAAYVRFIYAVPFAWAYALWLWAGQPSGLNTAFFTYVSMGSVAQIVATACLLSAFSGGNFAVGTAYSKTEAAQAAFFGLLVLGEGNTRWALAGIGVSLLGVLLLSGRFQWADMRKPNRAMWLGLAAGAGFAISAVGFRGASLALDAGDYLQRAGLTVMASVSLQTLLMGGYLWLLEPGQIRRVMACWRVAVWVGAIGMVASAGWFTAMTLKNAAVVRAVGQVELLFTVMTSAVLLKERLGVREYVGIALVIGGIWLLV
ncbi:MAG: DMT family transporter [Gammaproteobacteria bacterium]|nr:DMT family transporter [Gammaproteobacteria bacterium]